MTITPAITGAALRVFESRLVAYRRQWRGSAISTFLNPVLFLSAMGLGLGSLVDATADLGGIDYLAFYASGLLAAQAMQTGASDGAFPVMAGLKWNRTYLAALATPVTPGDLVVGHLGFVALKLAVAATVFAVVAATFGAFALVRGLVAVPLVVLCGLTYTVALMTITSVWRDDQILISTFRFGIVPMFLLSGTFFPVTQLPSALQWVAKAVPLWHGVELVRVVTLGVTSAWPPLAHVGYLLGCAALGTAVVMVVFDRQLVR